MIDDRYVVAGCRPWSRQAFDRLSANNPGRWHYVSSPAELTGDALRQFRPRYVFFLHWSWKVPADITSSFECVCFHMTDLPFGRGGSPLQHLIWAGHKRTQLSALQMTEEIDAGPIYCKDELSLIGRAQDIYERAADLAAGQIARIITETPTPQPQVGTAVVFRRRTPAESAMPVLDSAERVFDFIRMLDADGYPHAYVEHEGIRYEFRHAALEASPTGDPVVTARVTIFPTAEPRS